MSQITEFRYFCNKFLRLIILIGMVFYLNIYISEKSRVINSYNYNKAILYFFILYIFIIVSDMMTYESDYLNNLVYILLFCVLTIYIVNYLIHKYMYKGFWLSLLISFAFSILIFGVFLLCVWYSIYSQDKAVSDPVFLQFSYAYENNISLTQFMQYFFPICALLFWATNMDNKLGNFLNPNVMGFMTFIIICYVGFYYAISIRLIDKKQILNTLISFLILLYVISVFQSYFLLDSIQNTCYGTGSVDEKKKNSAFAELLFLLLIISIVLILILNDIRKWSFFNYLSYLFITVFIILCMFTYSAIYPSTALLSFWGFIEWCILTSYNNHDTFNSFSFVMMNHKYHLKSKDIEGK